MTGKQKFLQAIYPLLMTVTRVLGKNAKIIGNKLGLQPASSFYHLQDTAIDGTPVSFESLRGKKILLVNTASDCGYTGQYRQLQKLYQLYKGQLVIIGFPSNDFKEQEKGSDEDIASFCRQNYGVDFMLMKKSKVTRYKGQNKVFEWLSDARFNGWNSQQPTWNFSKYLVNESGVLVSYFGPSVSPLSKALTELVDNTLSK